MNELFAAPVGKLMASSEEYSPLFLRKTAIPSPGGHEIMLGLPASTTKLDLGGGAISSLFPPDSATVALKSQVTSHKAKISAASSVGERLFDSRVSLKVATAKYAMHLSDDARARLFKEIDYLLDEGGWDSEDTTPSAASYMQFLKWTIFTGDLTWSSLGIADDGNVLAAWRKSGNQMTANFGKRVRWTQRIEIDGELQHAAGDFTLEHFARHATAFLVDFE